MPATLIGCINDTKLDKYFGREWYLQIKNYKHSQPKYMMNKFIGIEKKMKKNEDISVISIENYSGNSSSKFL